MARVAAPKYGASEQAKGGAEPGDEKDRLRIETAIETAIAVAAGVLATTGVGIETIDPRILPTLTKVRAGLPDGQLRQEYQPPEEFNQRVAEGRVVTAEVEAARTNRSI